MFWLKYVFKSQKISFYIIDLDNGKYLEHTKPLHFIFPLCMKNYRSRGPGFDSRALQEKKVVGLERGPLSLVSTTEELLDRKVAAPV
jgi:hypothetical protein